MAEKNGAQYILHVCCWWVFPDKTGANGGKDNQLWQTTCLVSMLVLYSCWYVCVFVCMHVYVCIVRVCTYCVFVCVCTYCAC